MARGYDLSRLDWAQLKQRDWIDFIQEGMPAQLAILSARLGDRTGRRITVFTMPTRDARIPGLCVPFLDEDGIIVDPSVLNDPSAIAGAVAQGLASMMYPGWTTRAAFDDLTFVRRDEFIDVLAPLLLTELPVALDATDALVRAALSTLPPG